MPVDSGVLLSGTLVRQGSIGIITNGNRNADHPGQWPGDAVTAFDRTKAGPRHIIKFAPYDYRCWYEGVDDTNTDGSAQTRTVVNYATSSNGTDWIKYSGNPVIAPAVTGAAPTWEHNEFSIGTVLWDPDAGLFKLWGHGGNNSGPRQIAYATSTDGIAWTKSASNPVILSGAGGTWNEGLIADITVIRFNASEYRAWVKGATIGGVVSYGYYTSADGVAWSQPVTNPICASSFVAGQSLTGCHVALINGAFHMWMGTAANGLYYSSSTDGTTWATPISVMTAADGSGDTIGMYVDGTTVRVQYGVDEGGLSPARRAIWEAWLVSQPPVANQNPVAGHSFWPNGTVGVSAWASLANNAAALSGQITTDRYNGHRAAITVTMKTGATPPLANRHWEVWLQSSTAGGTSGGPDFHTIGNVFLGIVPAPTAASTLATAQFDTAGVVAILPETWAVMLVNRTGQTMAAAGHSCVVQMGRAG